MPHPSLDKSSEPEGGVWSSEDVTPAHVQSSSSKISAGDELEKAIWNLCHGRRGVRLILYSMPRCIWIPPPALDKRW
jgi:hypothetical protein